jgi:hypothetical protein
MTLIEVEKATRVPVNHIIETMKLPSSISREERLEKRCQILTGCCPVVRKSVFSFYDVKFIKQLGVN